MTPTPPLATTAARFLEESLIPLCAAPRRVTLVFLGCGDGATEAAVLRELVRRSHPVTHAVFMDVRATPRLHAVMDALRRDVPTTLEFVGGYGALTAWLMHEWSTPGTGPGSTLVPIGINNAVHTPTADDLWAAWRFFVACERALVADPHTIVRDYANILDNTDGTYDRFESYSRFGVASVARFGWFSYASTIISDRGAHRLLCGG